MEQPLYESAKDVILEAMMPAGFGACLLTIHIPTVEALTVKEVPSLQ